MLWMPQKITPKIIHLTNWYWMNESFPCGYGCISQERIEENEKHWDFLIYL
jgi:hypothetical protein